MGERIAASNLLLFFVTPQSVVSEHCVRELNYAMDQKIPPLIVHLEQTELPHGLGMALSSTQAIMRHELSDLDYRITLLNGASDHLRRGVGVAEAPTPIIQGLSGRAMAAGGLVIALVAAALTATIMLNRTPPRAEQPLKRFDINLADAEVGIVGAQISSDGSRIVFRGSEDADSQLYTRKLGDLAAVPIRGTQGSFGLGISPDGEWVLFRDSDGLKKVRVEGGTPVTVVSGISSTTRGFTWGSNDMIVYAPPDYLGIMGVSATGGVPQKLTTPEEGTLHLWPVVLPDGDGLLFTAGGLELDVDDFQVGHLSFASGEQKILLSGSGARVTASGHLLFQREGVVWAAAFDSELDAVIGDPVPVLDGVAVQALGLPLMDTSDGGTLIYLSGEVVHLTDRSLVWVDRDGVEEDLGSEPMPYVQPRLSPDGKQIAVIVADPDAGRDIWVHDIELGAMNRLTFDERNESMPEWGTDSRTLVFGYQTEETQGHETQGLFTKAADGTGSVERLTELDLSQRPTLWSSDGLTMLFEGCSEVTFGCDPWTLNLEGEPSPKPLWESESNERYATLSPDNKWIAYESNKSGDAQIYVRPYPNVDDGLWQVSRDGGQQPQWGPNGKEIIYWGRTHMMLVPVETEPSFSPRTPEPLFSLSGYLLQARNYAVSPDGNRFLMVRPAARGDDRPRIILVQNWFDELERLAPHPK